MARATTSPTTSPPNDHDTQVSVVIPVHNEADNIPQLFDELQDVFANDSMAPYWPYEILFVEDGSTDGTHALVDQLARDHDTVAAIHLKRSYGQSAALQAGFDHAHGQYVVPMDGDLQNDPRDIPRLLRMLEDGYDCVSGWRKDRQDPWHKTIPSAIQTRLATLTGPDIHDYGCTLKAYRAEAIDDIDIYGEGHRYIPSKLYDKGYDITEVEVNHRPRAHGDSRYGIGRLIRGFVDLLFHWYWLRYSTRPLHVFGLLGFLMMAAGTTIGGVSVIQRLAFDVPLGPRTPRLILISLLVLTGLHLLLFGWLAETLTKLHYDDKRPYRIDSRIH